MRYSQTQTKEERAQIVWFIYDSIQNRGGRFLKKQPEQQQQETGDSWYVLSEQQAKDKISHAIRDATANSFEVKKHSMEKSEPEKQDSSGIPWAARSSKEDTIVVAPSSAESKTNRSKKKKSFTTSATSSGAMDAARDTGPSKVPKVSRIQQEERKRILEITQTKTPEDSSAHSGASARTSIRGNIRDRRRDDQMGSASPFLPHRYRHWISSANQTSDRALYEYCPRPTQRPRLLYDLQQGENRGHRESGADDVRAPFSFAPPAGQEQVNTGILSPRLVAGTRLAEEYTYFDPALSTQGAGRDTSTLPPPFLSSTPHGGSSFYPQHQEVLPANMISVPGGGEIHVFPATGVVATEEYPGHLASSASTDAARITRAINMMSTTSEVAGRRSSAQDFDNASSSNKKAVQKGPDRSETHPGEHRRARRPAAMLARESHSKEEDRREGHGHEDQEPSRVSSLTKIAAMLGGSQHHNDSFLEVIDEVLGPLKPEDMRNSVFPVAAATLIAKDNGEKDSYAEIAEPDVTALFLPGRRNGSLSSHCVEGALFLTRKKMAHHEEEDPKTESAPLGRFLHAGRGTPA
eukprot:CAMPEP_0172442056 /NCGR_PEP_ID=MMETSP1065-20121228/2518_1 /TAXON_ID=265537 /ORGANISM="Amphiprora paludosa, Strain CCMP125" /LENGTH=577 /DNA_ID=CAMNT_0013191727 /DNA_START=193 /DNA_END=1927 /DNA_ORIENTATION=+